MEDNLLLVEEDISAESTAADTRKKAEEIDWNDTRILLLLRAYKQAFVDNDVEFGKNEREWEKITASLNANPVFNCEDDNFVPHESSKFKQKVARMKKALKRSWKSVQINRETFQCPRRR